MPRITSHNLTVIWASSSSPGGGNVKPDRTSTSNGRSSASSFSSSAAMTCFQNSSAIAGGTSGEIRPHRSGAQRRRLLFQTLDPGVRIIWRLIAGVLVVAVVFL
jgi:hypothetical protein